MDAFDQIAEALSLRVSARFGDLFIFLARHKSWTPMLEILSEIRIQQIPHTCIDLRRFAIAARPGLTTNTFLTFPNKPLRYVDADRTDASAICNSKSPRSPRLSAR